MSVSVEVGVVLYDRLGNPVDALSTDSRVDATRWAMLQLDRYGGSMGAGVYVRGTLVEVLGCVG